MRQLALILALLATGAVASSGVTAIVDPLAMRAAGDWRLSEVGGKIACTLTLSRETSSAGYALKAPLACRRAFPALKTVAAWSVDPKGAIVLSDANAAPLLTFPAQAGLPYEAKSPDGRTWRLEPLKPDPAATTPDAAPKPAAS